MFYMFTFVERLVPVCKTSFSRLDVLAFFVVSLPFFGYFFLSPFLFGTDSYFFLSFLRFGEWFSSAPPVLAGVLFSFLRLVNFNEWLFSFDFFPLKFLLYLVFLSCCVLLHLVGRKVSSISLSFSPVWFLVFSPALYGQFFQLENDLFAFPFLLLSFWFALRYREIESLTGDQYIYYALASLLLLLPAGGFWYGSIYFVPVILLYLGGFFRLLFVFLLPFVREAFWFLFSRGVAELVPGVFWLGFSWLGLFYILLNFNAFSVVSLYLLLLGVAQFKLVLFSVFFLAVGCAVLFSRFWSDNLPVVVVFCVGFVVFYCLSFFPPFLVGFQNEVAVNSVALSELVHLPIIDGAGVGYHVLFYGGTLAFPVSNLPVRDYCGFPAIVVLHESVRPVCSLVLFDRVGPFSVYLSGFS